MNLFLLHSLPQIAAMQHCDKHCVKMILEICQLLYTSWWCNHGKVKKLENDPCPHDVYKCTHKNHPSAIWVRVNPKHYDWALELGLCLCRQYTMRYGRTHRCESHLQRLCKLKWPEVTPESEQFPKCKAPHKRATVGLPLECEYFDCAISDDVWDECAHYEKGQLHGVKTYRNYYKTKGSDKWTLKWYKNPKNAPPWFRPSEESYDDTLPWDNDYQDSEDNDDMGIDKKNILNTKRIRKSPIRYVDEDYATLMLADIDDDELDAALVAEVSDYEEDVGEYEKE